MSSMIISKIYWFLIRTPFKRLLKLGHQLRHRQAVLRRRSFFPAEELGPEQLKALESLERYGFADANALVDREILLTAYETAIRKTRQEGLTEGKRLNRGKDFWERLLDEDLDTSGRHSIDSPFVKIAAQERILSFVAAYFRDAPLLDYIYLLHSSHKPGPLRVSQLWHRDHDDTKVLKLFVYLSDCLTLEDGPFTFIPADISKEVTFGLHSHRTDSELGVAASEPNVKVMTGPKLSAFFVDTSRCYHMGSRVAPGHERLLFMGAYATFPKFNGRPTNRFVVNDRVSERLRIALTYA